MAGEIKKITSNLANLLTQLIYNKTDSPQKGIAFFRKAWNMSLLFWIYFYQITYQLDQ